MRETSVNLWRGWRTRARAALLLSALFLADGAASAALAQAASRAARASVPATGAQRAERLTGHVATPVSLGYLLFVPRDYGREADRRWPLILYLHGGSQRGNDLRLLKGYGLPRMLDRRPDFPAVVVSPQCPPGETWLSVDGVMRLLDQVQARYRIDPRRVYVTGTSMGGAGAWYLAYRFPERFAAIAPLATYDPNPYWASSGRLRNVPVWAIHGSADTLAPIEGEQQMVRLLQRTGGNVRLTVLPGRGHSITDVFEDMRLYDWLLSQQRPATASPRARPPRRTPATPR